MKNKLYLLIASASALCGFIALYRFGLYSIAVMALLPLAVISFTFAYSLSGKDEEAVGKDLKRKLQNGSGLFVVFLWLLFAACLIISFTMDNDMPFIMPLVIMIVYFRFKMSHLNTKTKKNSSPQSEGDRPITDGGQKAFPLDPLGQERLRWQKRREAEAAKVPEQVSEFKKRDPLAYERFKNPLKAEKSGKQKKNTESTKAQDIYSSAEEIFKKVIR